MKDTVNPDELQGNILRGYKRGFVRHLLLGVRDRASARAFLGAAVAGGHSDVPAITRESRQKWRHQSDGRKPDSCFNIGITFDGLRALGVPEASLATFPTEFVAGMAQRAVKLGDVDDSKPENWVKPFNRPERIHLIASIYADHIKNIYTIQAQVESAFVRLGALDGRSLPGNRVFFNYIDGISQPRFEGFYDPEQVGVDESPDLFGTALLGHPTRLGRLMFRVPSPDVLGFNGSFNAFRMLAQDCAGFEDYLSEAADTLLSHRDVNKLLPQGAESQIRDAFNLDNLSRRDALREIVAAQLCGRWRLNSAPLVNAPDAPGAADPAKALLTNFDYTRDSVCPAGAHIRRANPRGAPIVQRISSRTRRLLRRGMVYGPDFDPKRPDKIERGLLGNFIGASLGAQFEAVMYDWLNLGLQDPDITGSNDPLIGANDPESSWFDLRLSTGGSIRLRGFPRFVTTRGGLYAFLPSLPAISYLAGLTEEVQPLASLASAAST